MRLVRRLLGFGLLAASVWFVRGRRRAARALDATLGASDADFDDTAATVDSARVGAGAQTSFDLGPPTEETVDFDDGIGTSVPANENEYENENLVEVATKSGIADVDPVPLSHVAGEGIDLDGDVKAHTELRELRDRLPR